MRAWSGSGDRRGGSPGHGSGVRTAGGHLAVMSMVDFAAVLAAWSAGALCLWWTDIWLVGICVCVVLTWLFHGFVRERVEGRVTRRDRAEQRARPGETAPVETSRPSGR